MHSAAATNATIGLTFVPNIQFSPFYAAIEQGYYKDAGFNVTLNHHAVGADQFGPLVGGNEQMLMSAGDEVLMTDHEYGAVVRSWRQRCQETGASLVIGRLPQPLESVDQVVDALFAGATPRTKLLVVSHVTSKTAVILPLREICARARRLGIPVCVDGPHALAMAPVEIDRLGCDFYAASCHKWLSAPFGSGFLYVHPRWQPSARPSIVSWGRTLSGQSSGWMDDFIWSGTRDPSAFLSVPAAITISDSPVRMRSAAIDNAFRPDEQARWIVEPAVVTGRPVPTALTPRKVFVPEPLLM